MVPAVFLTVYVGMILGGLPRLQVDRTGVALLGAIVLLVSGVLPLDAAVAHVHVPTLALLFGMMIVSAQLRLGGVYRAATRRVGGIGVGVGGLLALVIALVGVLSAVFTNDIVVLAVTPAVVALSRERDLNPVPFLLATACAANVGSAATLIGNPQNILIGQTLRLPFASYVVGVAPAVVAGLGVVWLVVTLAYRGRWDARAPAGHPLPDDPPLDGWQAAKGLGLGVLILLAFLLTSWPRELVALAAAGIVLSGRRFHSREMLGLVDWQLLVLFVGLFVVNGALIDSGLVARALAALAGHGVDVTRPVWLFGSSVVLSNTVSNVPAVMLLLPAAHGVRDGQILALSSTLAGNLFIVGSIANIIVVEQARASGIHIDWRAHARVGVPVTLATLALAALALALIPA
jgi:Na+/H+ antiporter NhaD/arsenite permease-like protein